MVNIRTDLVCETLDAAAEQGAVEGVDRQNEDGGFFSVDRITVSSQGASDRLGRKPGRYVTVTCTQMTQADGDDLCRLLDAVAAELLTLLGDAKERVLVVGLGNDAVTPDSLGPRTVSRTVVSRHIKNSMRELYDSLRLGDVAAVTPGVLGQTGVESFEIIKAVAERIRPTAVIAVDSLTARKKNRLAATVQLCDTGIVPGSGIHNSRSEISAQTMGIPVIAVGVPLVIDAATLAFDLSGAAADEETDAASELMVTPKQIDSIVNKTGMLLGFSINRAMHPSLSVEDMNTLLA